MQFQFNTGYGVDGTEAWGAEVEEAMRSALGHWTSHLTRIEVHLRDENAGKGGESDKRCEIEARIAGRPPLSVTDAAAGFEQAIHGATTKLEHALRHAVGKLESNRHGDHPNP